MGVQRKLLESLLQQKKTESQFAPKLDELANPRHPGFASVLCVTLWLGLTSPCELTWALQGRSLTVLVSAHLIGRRRNDPVLDC